jgi:zinc transport system ATP-binding protein
MNKSVEKNNLLELKNINLTIDGNKILENISLSLEKGKIKTLIGINGGGKTTLARIIIGAVKASSGEIIKQKNIKIGHMPQKIQVDKTIPMSVMDFIKLVNDANEPIIGLALVGKASIGVVGKPSSPISPSVNSSGSST